jgi:hypothetical protein
VNVRAPHHQVSGRASVKAKLKLGFTSTARKKVVAVKLLQVTQKAKGKREYKQLDSVLKTKDNAGNVRSCVCLG